MNFIKRSLVPVLSSGAALFVAACASIVYQGWDYGLNNNASHLAILFRHYEPELFPDNPFIDALANYCTAVWWLVKRLAPPEHLREVFFGLHVLSRVAIIVGAFLLLLHFARDLRYSVAISSVLAFSGMLQSFTPVSRSDVFISYTNHTSLAIGFFLLALAALVRRRAFLAGLLAGLVLDSNLFMGVWLVLIGCGYLGLTWKRDESERMWWSASVNFGSCAAFVGAPTLMWAASIVLNSAPLPDGYRYDEFLHLFFPYHYFLESSEAQAILLHVHFTVAGALAVWLLGERREHGAAILTMLLAIFFAGAVTPFFSSSALALNLQFMRVETYIDLVVPIFVYAAVAVQLRSAACTREMQFYLVLSAVATLLGYSSLMVLGFLLYANRQQVNQPKIRLILYALLISLGLSTAIWAVQGPELMSPRLQSGMFILGLIWALHRTSLSVVAVPAAAALFVFSGQHVLHGLAILSALAWAGAENGRRWYQIAICAALSTAIVLTVLVTLEILPDEWCALLAPVFRARTFNPDRSVHLVRLDHTVQLAVLSFGACLLACLSALSKPVLSLGSTMKDRQLQPALIGMALLVLIVPALISGAAFRVGRGELSNRDEEGKALVELRVWISENLPINALILVGFHYDSFSAFSNRNLWWSVKYADGVVCDPSLFEEYKRRRKLQKMAESWVLSDNEKLLPFVKSRDITHLITTQEPPRIMSGFDLLKSNSHFRIYGLRPISYAPGTADAH